MGRVRLPTNPTLNSRPPRHLEPPHVVPDGDLADVVAEASEDSPDLVDGLHHAADVLGCPVLGPGVVQDDDPHADTAAARRGTAAVIFRSGATSRPVSRRQAMRTTSCTSSS